MLTLTENATRVVKDLAAQSAAPDDGGVRISSQEAPNSFSLAAVTAGEPGDSVVESSGAKVYLEHDAAEALDDKILDASVDASGGVQFQLGQQA